MIMRMRWLAVLAWLLWLGPATAQTAAPPAPASAAAAGQRVGLVKSVQGEVRLLRADRSQEAKAGDAVLLGDMVRTGPASYAGITLTDDTLLAVGPGSELVISQYRFDPITQDGSLLASLWRGTLSVVTGLIAKKSPEQVKVQTRTVVMGVRGTEFIVDASQGTP